MLKRYISALITAFLCICSATAQDAQNIPIIAADCENGSILYLPESAAVGDYVDFAVKPHNGYVLDDIKCYYVKTSDGQPYSVIVPLGEANTLHYYFYMPECERIEIYATFKRAVYTVTIADNIQNGSLSIVQPTGNIEMGTLVRLNAQPDTDYLFDSASITANTGGESISYSTSSASGNDKFIDFFMPNDNVTVSASFKPAPQYAIKVAQYDKGTMNPFPAATARPGQKIELYADTEQDYSVINVKVLAGYEITGGGGSAHAPGSRKEAAAPLFFVQQEIPVTQLGQSLYSFTLPERFNNELSPNYQDNTEFRVTFDFQYIGPQAVYCQDNTTLYFVNPRYALKPGDTWLEHTVTQVWGEEILNTGWDSPGWYIYREEITNVEFARDFQAARPKSCFGWFYRCKKAQFTGLQYLNTSEVTVTNTMFCGCEAITTIDVNSFDVRNVYNATSMFRGCPNLTTIYCDNTWDIQDTPNMFFGSTKLLGAVPYNEGTTAGSMANPKTGYFTGKWNINIPDFEHGTVTSDKHTAYTNESVTLTITPDPEYELEGISIDIAPNSQLAGATHKLMSKRAGELGLGGTTSFTFTMPASPVVINATFVESIPTDVTDINIHTRPATTRRYDILGRPVSDRYKGIVIENGTKKIIH